MYWRHAPEDHGRRRSARVVELGHTQPPNLCKAKGAHQNVHFRRRGQTGISRRGGKGLQGVRSHTCQVLKKPKIFFRVKCAGGFLPIESIRFCAMSICSCV